MLEENTKVMDLKEIQKLRRDSSVGRLYRDVRVILLATLFATAFLAFLLSKTPNEPVPPLPEEGRVRTGVTVLYVPEDIPSASASASASASSEPAFRSPKRTRKSFQHREKVIIPDDGLSLPPRDRPYEPPSED